MLGLGLGALYVYGNRSLIGPLVCHGVVNAMVEPWLLLALLMFYAERCAAQVICAVPPGDARRRMPFEKRA